MPKFFAGNPVTARHKVKQILTVPPKHLYEIILNVDDYSQFLPFCTNSHILRRSDCGTMFDASLQIGFGSGSGIKGSIGSNLFQEEYVSRVTHKIQQSDSSRTEWIVTAKSIKSNLFDGLNSSWKLSEVKEGDEEEKGHGSGLSIMSDLIEEGQTSLDSPATANHVKRTNVEFEVEISVSDPIITVALESSLEEVARQQVAAFEKRCFDIPFQE